MGFFFGVLLLLVVVFGIWNFLVDKNSRANSVAEYQRNPLEWTFMMAWIACILSFFIGVFVPVLGETKLFGKDGLAIWQAGGTGSVVGLAILAVHSKIKSR